MKTLGIGMVGCGGMGMALAHMLLPLDDRLQVRGVFDPDARSIDRARTEFTPAPRVYDSFEECVAAPDIEWVMIASWNCFHAEQAIAAFEAGKHVFSQKPLATTFDDALALAAAWKRSGKMLNIGFTLRYSPHYRKIKELLAGGAIGDVVSMEFNETLDFNLGGYIMGDWRRLRKNAGPYLLEKCCHDIDLAYWMVDSLPSRVASFGGTNFFLPENAHHIERIGKDANGSDAYRTMPGLIGKNPFTSDKDIVDNQVSIIEYASGVRATFHTNCSAGIPERRMYILGTEGTLRADVIAGSIEVKRVGFDTPTEDASTEGQGGHGGGDEILARELADSMLKGVIPGVGLEEGLKSAVTCLAIDEALKQGTVVDMAAYWERAGYGD